MKKSKSYKGDLEDLDILPEAAAAICICDVNAMFLGGAPPYAPHTTLFSSCSENISFSKF